MTALLVGYAAQPLLGAGLAGLLGFTGLSEATRLSLSVAVALIVATVVQMVLGELACIAATRRCHTPVKFKESR